MERTLEFLMNSLWEAHYSLVGWHLWCASSVGRLTKYFFVTSGTFSLSNVCRNPARLSFLIFRSWFCETSDEIDCLILYSGYRLNSTMLIWALHPFFLIPAGKPFCWNGIRIYSSGDLTDNQDFSFHQGWMECRQDDHRLYGVCEFGGVERWNGTVEWTTGVEHWSVEFLFHTPLSYEFAFKYNLVFINS